MDRTIPQQLCVLCYKQCELFKYFKQQCEESYTKASIKTESSSKARNRNHPPVSPSTIYTREEETQEPKEEREPAMDIPEDSDETSGQEEDDSEEDYSEDDSIEDDGSFGYIQSTSFQAAPFPPPHMTEPAEGLSQPEPARKRIAPPNLSLASLSDTTRNYYMASYKAFCSWKEEVGAGETTEDVLLAYFQQKFKNGNSSITRLAHLKATLQHLDGVSIAGFKRLREYISQSNKSVVRKTASMFTRPQLRQFVREAPDEQYDTTKVVVSLWLAGCVRGHHIYPLKRLNVFDRGTHIEVFGVGPNKAGEYFIRPHLSDGYDPVPMIRKYLAESDDEFPYLLRGKVKNIRVGKKRINMMPKEVAKYLKLNDPSTYSMFSVPTVTRDKKNSGKSYFYQGV